MSETIEVKSDIVPDAEEVRAECMSDDELAIDELADRKSEYTYGRAESELG